MCYNVGDLRGLKMAEIYSLSKARRRQQSPRLPMPASLLTFSSVFGYPLPDTFTAYFLKRTKGGTEVHIKGGPLTLNLSYFTKTYPQNFKAARLWIASVADRHGWRIVEVTSRL